MFTDVVAAQDRAEAPAIILPSDGPDAQATTIAATNANAINLNMVMSLL